MMIKYMFLTSALAALLLSDVVNSFILKTIHQKKSALTNKIKIRYGSNQIREPEVIFIILIYQKCGIFASASTSSLQAHLKWNTLRANKHHITEEAFFSFR